MRLLIIGVDGTSWNYINYGLEKGKLPNIKKLIDTEISGNFKLNVIDSSEKLNKEAEKIADNYYHVSGQKPLSIKRNLAIKNSKADLVITLFQHQKSLNNS